MTIPRLAIVLTQPRSKLLQFFTVTRLVNALQNSSLTVWWDRGLAGGHNWRTEIHHALAAAKCVIVVWTRASVGPDGDFVRDEAQNAKRRNILIPVILDPVDPPLGFGEIQAIDLTRWNGPPRDPFFQDLLASVKATIEGRPLPPAHGPTKRLLRRLRLQRPRRSLHPGHSGLWP